MGRKKSLLEEQTTNLTPKNRQMIAAWEESTQVLYDSQQEEVLELMLAARINSSGTRCPSSR